MKIDMTLEGRPKDSAATPVKHAHSQAGLKPISRLRPAKLTSGRRGFGKTRKPRRSRLPGVGPAPVVVLPVSNENLGAAEPSHAEPSSTKGPRGDNLQLYLREIGQVQLLTPAQE